jgi:hypothetical protein
MSAPDFQPTADYMDGVARQILPEQRMAGEMWPEAYYSDEDQVDRDEVVERARDRKNQDAEDQRDERLDDENVDVSDGMHGISLNHAASEKKPGLIR